MLDDFLPLPDHATHLARRSFVLLHDILLDPPSPVCPVFLLVVSTISLIFARPAYCHTRRFPASCTTTAISILDDPSVSCTTPGLVFPYLPSQFSPSRTRRFFKISAQFFHPRIDDLSHFCTTCFAVVPDELSFTIGP
jgi:hypothetical protein